MIVRTRLLQIFAFIAVGSLFAAACGGSDDEPAPEPGAQAATASDAADATSQATQADDASADDPPAADEQTVAVEPSKPKPEAEQQASEQTMAEVEEEEDDESAEADGPAEEEWAPRTPATSPQNRPQPRRDPPTRSRCDLRRDPATPRRLSTITRRLH